MRGVRKVRHGFRGFGVHGLVQLHQHIALLRKVVRIAHSWLFLVSNQSLILLRDQVVVVLVEPTDLLVLEVIRTLLSRLGGGGWLKWLELRCLDRHYGFELNLCLHLKFFCPLLYNGSC